MAPGKSSKGWLKDMAAVASFIATAFLLTAQTASAQTIKDIREAYNGVKEYIAMMSDDFPSEGIPPEYYHLHVAQNLPATGGHFEDVYMYYFEVEQDEENWTPYPDHWLRLVSSKYIFAAREYYEEYLYDEKGQAMFIYVCTPDIDGMDLFPVELRMWFDGDRLLRFSAKGPGTDFTGTTIPELYQEETSRCIQRARRFAGLFKSIDTNTYL